MERDEFIAMASHELRTPVQNVSMALESMEHSELNTDQRKSLSMAASAANDLEVLVNDILHMASMSHHSAVLKNEVIDSHALVQTLHQGFTTATQRKHLAFDLHIDNDVPRKVLTDPLRLKQILYNIIGNAIKYTESGKISVVMSMARQVDELADSVVRLQVSDTGIGIHEAQLKKIFEPRKSWRAQSASSNQAYESALNRFDLDQRLQGCYGSYFNR